MKYCIIIIMLLLAGCGTTRRTTRWTTYGFDTFNVLDRTQHYMEIGLRSDGAVVWRVRRKPFMRGEMDGNAIGLRAAITMAPVDANATTNIDIRNILGED